MVIIKCNVALPPEERRGLEINIHDQAADGVIVLPYFCDLLTVTPGEGVQIVQQARDARVAELEQELARAMFYLSAEKACVTCKHFSKAVEICGCCDECQTVNAIVCCKCHEGSLWEWVGIHGSK